MKSSRFIISTLLLVEKDREEIFQQIYGKSEAKKPSNKTSDSMMDMYNDYEYS